MLLITLRTSITCEEAVNYFMATRDTIQYPSSHHSSIMLGFSFSVHKPVVKGKGMDHINLKSN